jgi:hypothetical protein
MMPRIEEAFSLDGRSLSVNNYALMNGYSCAEEMIADNSWCQSPLTVATTFSYEEEVYFDPAPHLKVISDAIVEAVLGLNKRFIIVSMPPRHGKSWLITRRTPEWYLSVFPRKMVGVVGYGTGFVRDWGRLIRNDLDFHEDLIGFGIADDSGAADRWHTSLGGELWAQGTGGQVVGRGADLLIIDDPIKNMSEAYSPAYRDALWTMWKSGIRTRLHPGGVVVVVMQRWHSDDFAGRLLGGFEDTDPSVWREIRLPAIWDGDAPDVIGRQKGQALWPARYNLDELNGLKRGMDAQTWDAVYQQIPVNLQGAGLVYYGFKPDQHVFEMERDVRLPMFWGLDFNVDPMSNVIGQVKEMWGPHAHLTNQKISTVEVLDEISLPNSNTVEACKEFHARCQAMNRGARVELHVYGDASGNQRHTNATKTDWQIVRQFLNENSRYYGAHYHVPSQDPPVRDRTNSMNGALRAADGEKSLFIHPRCKELIKDFKGIVWKRDSNGNATSQLDKSDPMRSHMSDALGYVIYQKFGLNEFAGEVSGSLV